MLFSLLKCPDRKPVEWGCFAFPLFGYHFCVDNFGTSQWKFAFLSLGRPEYLQDSDIVSSRFQVMISLLLQDSFLIYM